MNTCVMNVSTSLRLCNHFQRPLLIHVQNAKASYVRFITMLGLSLRAVVFIKPIQELLQHLPPLLQKPKVKKRQLLKLRVSCDAAGDHFWSPHHADHQPLNQPHHLWSWATMALMGFYHHFSQLISLWFKLYSNQHATYSLLNEMNWINNVWKTGPYLSPP